MSGADTVVATHADREAAKAIYPYCNDHDGTLAGLFDDHSVIQAFARHRLATQADALAVMREAEAVLSRQAEGWANCVEFDLLPKQHHGNAKKLERQAQATLASIRAAIGKGEG